MVGKLGLVEKCTRPSRRVGHFYAITSFRLQLVPASPAQQKKGVQFKGLGPFGHELIVTDQEFESIAVGFCSQPSAFRTHRREFWLAKSPRF